MSFELIIPLLVLPIFFPTIDVSTPLNLHIFNTMGFYSLLKAKQLSSSNFASGLRWYTIRKMLLDCWVSFGQSGYLIYLWEKAFHCSVIQVEFHIEQPTRNQHKCLSFIITDILPTCQHNTVSKCDQNVKHVCQKAESIP